MNIYIMTWHSTPTFKVKSVLSNLQTQKSQILYFVKAGEISHFLMGYDKSLHFKIIIFIWQDRLIRPKLGLLVTLTHTRTLMLPVRHTDVATGSRVCLSPILKLSTGSVAPGAAG